MTKKYEMPEVFHEALAFHLILQAGGVKAEDIFVTSSAFTEGGKRDQLGVVVIEGGCEVYSVAIGPVGMTSEDFRERWPRAVAELKAMTNEEVKEFRDTAKVRNRAIEVFRELAVRRSLHHRSRLSR